MVNIQKLLSFVELIAPETSGVSKTTAHERTFEFMKMAASKKEIRRALNLLNFGYSPDDAIKRMMQKGSTEDNAIAAVLTAVEQLKPAEELEGPVTERGLPSFEDEEPEEPDFSMFETVEKKEETEPKGEWGAGALRDILQAGEEKILTKEANDRFHKKNIKFKSALLKDI